MRSYVASQTIKCEWCGKRISEVEAWEYNEDRSFHLMFCSERCWRHAPSLAKALLIASKPRSGYTYIASRHTLPK